VQNTRTPNAFSVMKKLDQDDTCSLHYAADMCKDLTAGLLKMKQVSHYRGEVTAANFEDHVRITSCRYHASLPFKANNNRCLNRTQHGQFGFA
jgi:hypothetical protein